MKYKSIPILKAITMLRSDRKNEIFTNNKYLYDLLNLLLNKNKYKDINITIKTKCVDCLMYLNGVRTQNQVYVPIIPSNTEVKETPNSLKNRSLFLKYTNKKTSGVSAALITDAGVH